MQKIISMIIMGENNTKPDNTNIGSIILGSSNMDNTMISKKGILKCTLFFNLFAPVVAHSAKLWISSVQ